MKSSRRDRTMASRKRPPAKKDIDKWGGPEQPKLPPGLKLLRTLEGNQGVVMRVAFDSRGAAGFTQAFFLS